MRRFADVPIRRKLFIIGWITSLSAVSLMMAIFVVSAYVIGLRNLQTGLGVQAAIVSGNLSSAASSDDPVTADATLRPLNSTQTFDLACAYTSHPTLLGQYVRAGGGFSCPAWPPLDGQMTGLRGASIVAPILQTGRRVGTLYIRGNVSRLLEQLRLQLLSAFGGFVVGLLSAMLIAGRLHRQIADPLVALSRTSAEIAREGDYSLRARQQGRDEIGALVEAFNDMVSGIERRDEELRTANRQKDDFLAVLSHELRTPLNAIVGWLQILRMQPKDPEIIERALTSLDRNARAQARLIEDMLDVSRIITGKLQLKAGVVDLCSVVEASTDVIRPAADQKGLVLDLRIATPSPCFVSGDSDRLQQVVSNLLSNAVKFTATGGRVEVRLSEAGSDYAVRVRDTGIGVAPEFLPRVFDRFRQADGSVTRAHGGLGLGLAIVRDLVVLHGGRVEAASDGDGKGATFTIVLPQLLAAQVDGPRETSPVSMKRLDGFLVLVADDDLDARHLAAQALQAAGARVELVAGGVEALRILEHREFGAFVCDIAMPDIDGYSLLLKIRELELIKGRFMPAVAVTAHAGVADEARAHIVGYQAFVVKPYEFSTLSNAVATAAGVGPPLS
jgi:signal transduction histidine kinase/ActR/RegA family two-component response regulator